MASAVDIINLALSHLGDSAKVSSIDPPDQSIQALHASRFYPIARDAALSRHAWGFATKRVKLSELALDEVLYRGWSFGYAWPSECLRVLEVVPPLGLSSLLPGQPTFTVESKADGSRLILTNIPADDAVIRYIARVSDTTKFSPPFVNYLSYELAVLLSGPIRKNAQFTRALRQDAREQLIIAAGQDSNGQNADAARRRAFVPDWVRARGFSGPTVPDAWVDRS